MANGLSKGNDGKIELDGNTLINLSAWSFDDETPVLSVAVFDQDMMKVAGTGIRTISGSASGYLDTTTASYQVSAEGNFLNGTSATAKLYFNTTEYFTGTVYFSKMSVSSEADDSIVPISFDFMVDGGLTRASD